jgi:hypothetical protein
MFISVIIFDFCYLLLSFRVNLYSFFSIYLLFLFRFLSYFIMGRSDVGCPIMCVSIYFLSESTRLKMVRSNRATRGSHRPAYFLLGNETFIGSLL